MAKWTKKVIQSAEPWVSSEMERGVKWMTEVSKSLDEHSIGILCVTSGNAAAPWLNFEAGALSKHLGDDGRIIPYLLDFRSASDLKFPLGQFNASIADQAGTWDLVKTLNMHAEYPQAEDALREAFDMWWPKLEEELRSIRESGASGQSPRRSTDDKVDELLELSRKLLRRLPDVGVDSRTAGENAIPRLWFCPVGECEHSVVTELRPMCPLHDIPMRQMTSSPDN